MLVPVPEELQRKVLEGARRHVSRAVDIQERNNWARLQVVQPMYNLVKRQAEVELLPMAEANGIGVIPYSPAAGHRPAGRTEAEDLVAA